jgi:hypothetical protein
MIDTWGLIPGRKKVFSLLYSVETGSGAHQAFYLMDIEGSFTGN